jgi:hypothetical protein
VSEFKEVKTAELTGAALDWAVTGTGCLTIEQNGLRFDRLHRPTVGGDFEMPYQPSTNWAQGGLLIARFNIDMTVERKDLIYASVCDDAGMPVIPGDVNGAFGPTHLIAACRALVVFKTGEWVCIPKELLS